MSILYTPPKYVICRYHQCKYKYILYVGLEKHKDTMHAQEKSVAEQTKKIDILHLCCHPCNAHWIYFLHSAKEELGCFLNGGGHQHCSKPGTRLQNGAFTHNDFHQIDKNTKGPGGNYYLILIMNCCLYKGCFLGDKIFFITKGTPAWRFTLPDLLAAGHVFCIILIIFL